MMNKEKYLTTLKALQRMRGIADDVYDYFDSIPEGLRSDELNDCIGNLGHLDDIIMGCIKELNKLGR
jgi:hypothetical protein